jgi:hypothetical protein
MATQRFYDGQPGPDIRRELNNFEAILDGTVAAAQDASTDAISASVKAQQWADAAPGVEVETGKYSAKHWADRAQTTVTGGLIYRGSHSAASGAYPATPSLGDYYKISAAGTLGGVDYSVGDSIIYNGTDWDKIDSTDAVTSVAGRVGAVVLTKGDVGLGNVDNTSDLDKPVSTAVQTALNAKEGTIAGGTAAQFWRGDKTWRDFFTDVRAATLTGLSTATNAVVAATDTVLTAIGKLQAQITAHFGAGGAAHSAATSSVNGFMSGADKTKLDAIAAGATANSTDAQLRDRTTHTGEQAISTVSGLQDALDGTVKTTGDQTVGGSKTFTGYLALNNPRFSQNVYSIGFELGPSVGTGNTNIQGFYVGSGKTLWFGANAGGGVMTLDGSGHFAASGSITAGGGILNTSGAIGYGVGAGGTVVQATSKFTNVTLNKPCGRITMHNAALAAGDSVIFSLMNFTISITDEVSVTMIGGHYYRVEVIDVWNGGCSFRVTNISANSLSNALAFNFKIFKVSTS